MGIKCLKLNELNECMTSSKKVVKYMLEDEIATNLDSNQTIIKENQIDKPSLYRTKVKCPIFYDCGGCDLLHILDSYQLELKQKKIKELFEQASLNVEIKNVIKNEQPLHYRHKVVLSATTSKQKLRLGLYREKTKKVIPFLNCFIQDQEINLVMKSVEELLNQYKISAYDIDKKSGIIKHVLMRKSYANQDLMLVFVTQGNLFPNHKPIIQKLISLHPKIKTVVQNIHRKDTRLVLLEEEKILYGKGFIEDEIDGIKFRLSPRSFYQVNPRQMEKLYQKAIELADIKKHEVILDTYSGVGTISLLMSKKAKHVYAIEINKDAHHDAVFNKNNNNIKNVTMILDDVEKRMLELDQQIDCLIMDPTRDGASIKFLESVLKLRPKRIVYISCEPKTQVRDLKILSEKYDIKVSIPVDMFSQTIHVESITFLSLKMA